VAPFRSRERDEPADDLAQLRQSVQTRGQAKIPEAAFYTDSYLQNAAAAANVISPEGRAWLRDRLRFMMVAGWAAWFSILDRIPEGPELRGEWRSLTIDVQRFGPEHLVAWWWLVSEPLFRPTVAAQLEVMKNPLVDGAADIQGAGKSFKNEMVNWDRFFAS
jgi:hypothetical protein